MEGRSKRRGEAVVLTTLSANGFPHHSFLSEDEWHRLDDRSVALAVITSSRTAANLVQRRIATLLFLGPHLELASGLVVSRAPRRAALAVPLFLPSFALFTVVCTKAWIDGLLGRPYAWNKTPRTGHGQTRAVESAVAA